MARRSVGVRIPVSNIGVSIVGFLNTPIGLGESARRQVRALRAAGVFTSNHSIPIPRLPTVPFEPVDTGIPKFRQAIFHINPPEMLQATRRGQLFPETRLYRMGYWAWELPVLPGAWVPAVDLVDEIWVPSNFIADCFVDVTKKPVRVIPHAVPSNTRDKREARTTFDLPEDAFIFLSMFDTNSFPQRKNPAGVIHAFRDAFPDGAQSRPMLVVKMHGQDNRSSEFHELLTAAANDPCIRIIDRTLSDEEVQKLQAACDCFVSLHRSEGFGLNIAECMAAGKAVITTDFSGNTDFTNTSNAVMIPYAMRKVLPEDYQFGRGQWWAEPSHEAAVEAIRWVVENPAKAQALGETARSHMAANYSFEAVGRTLKAALVGRPEKLMLKTPTAKATRGQLAATPGRNEPCFCGSGKKYKNCHGAFA